MRREKREGDYMFKCKKCFREVHGEDYSVFYAHNLCRICGQEVLDYFDKPLSFTDKVAKMNEESLKRYERIEKIHSDIKSSVQPRLDLITYHFLTRLAARCELGIERKGDKAWNALSNNWGCLTDIELAIDRCAHIANHAFRMMADLQIYRQSVKGSPFVESDDNAAAIAWGAMYLCEVGKRLKEGDSKV